MPPKKARKTRAAGDGPVKRRKKVESDDDNDFDSDDHDNGNNKEDDSVNNHQVEYNDDNQDEKLLPQISELSGRLLVCGGTNWDLIGRKELPKSAAKQGGGQSAGKNLWGPHKTPYRVKAVFSSCTACHSIIITDDNRALSWGRNDRGQLGHADCQRRDEPTEIEALKNYQIVSAAVGRSHSLFLTSKGHVYACGDNKMGQLGLGSQSQCVMTPARISYGGKPIVKLACGAEFSMILDAIGNLYSFGSPEYGQLGHNTEGKYFASGNKLAFRCELSPRRVFVYIEKTRDGHVYPLEDVAIVDVACGINHTLAVDSKKRCFSWGFGGYGRLGHSETKDELVPRNIKTFDSLNRGVKRVWCGGTFSMALDENGLLYFWGQSKSSGEATMYPKNVQDLNGWNIRAVACANKSTVVVADESMISWGPSPTWGELGYGENKSKSSTTPQEVKPMEGIHVHHVSCGYAHTLILARDEDEKEKQLIEALPSWP